MATLVGLQPVYAYLDSTQASEIKSKREKFQAHEGPIWQLTWAEPACGNLLASCSYDKTITIWQEDNCKLIKMHTMNKYD